MMKYLLMLMFLMPLLLMSEVIWLIQFILLVMSFFIVFSGGFMNYWVNISYVFGSDNLSYGLIILSFWICMLMLMASEKINFEKNNMVYFNCLVIFMLMFLYLVFSSLNIFMFYLFFEASLIPIFLMILGWGYQPERIQAGIYLLFYTLLASLPMMIGIFFYYYIYMTLDFSLYMNYIYNNSYFYFCMIIAFLVKMPMFMFHLWLPKAHVEAPIAGSMILAGLLLKLGGYGLLRLMMILYIMGINYSFLFMSIGLIGGVIVSLICVRQVDMKLLIAYSSVAHMGLVLCGVMTFSYLGVWGSYLMMISHGLCSSAMFCLANFVYERLSSRSMLLTKGLMSFMPSMSMWWFLMSSCNMAAPPSLNLMSEIVLINSLISWSIYTIIFVMMMSFFSAVYSLYLYSFSQHGKFYSGLYSFSLGNIREYLLIFLHWVPLNFFILKSNLFFFWI